MVHSPAWLLKLEKEVLIQKTIKKKINEEEIKCNLKYLKRRIFVAGKGRRFNLNLEYNQAS